MNFNIVSKVSKSVNKSERDKSNYHAKDRASILNEFINSNRFIINKDGTIYDVDKNKPVHACPNNKGYLYVSFRGLHFAVHTVIATKFITNTYGLPCVNHKDEDKLNNHVDNLEWCSYSYNNGYWNKGEHFRKLYCHKVIKNGDVTYDSIKNAADDNNLTVGRLGYYFNKYKRYTVDGNVYEKVAID